ncbi:alpha/beta fold hydrolase [Halostella litorea]|uniref:alpha/beta fold hydrolase n=1 Tax=Halostella litorea TaxID=2528831 RepID=UPI001092B19E|nr:alpha/beta hydrolase [Halostella litorea]
MPTANNDGATLYYEADGEGETVAFVGDAGYGAWQWGWTAPAVAGPFETLVYDHRGTGRSDAPAGPYDVETLAADLDAVLAAAGARSAHLVGAGLGGLVALAYAHRHSRAETLTLLATPASGGDLREPADRLLADPSDPAALRGTLDAAFSPDFVDRQPEVVDGVVEWRAAGDAGPDASRAQAAAAEAYDPEPLYEVTLPALVLAGEDDPVVPVASAERLAADLPRGEFASFAGRHLFFAERSRPVNDRVQGFLESQSDVDLE